MATKFYTYEQLLPVLDSMKFVYCQICNTNGDLIALVGDVDGDKKKKSWNQVCDEIKEFLRIFGDGEYLLKLKQDVNHANDRMYKYYVRYQEFLPEQKNNAPAPVLQGSPVYYPAPVHSPAPVTLNNFDREDQIKKRLRDELNEEARREGELTALREYRAEMDGLGSKLTYIASKIIDGFMNKKPAPVMQGVNNNTMSNSQFNVAELNQIAAQLNQSPEKKVMCEQSLLLLLKNMSPELLSIFAQMIYSKPELVDVLCAQAGVNKAQMMNGWGVSVHPYQNYTATPAVPAPAMQGAGMPATHYTKPSLGIK